MARPATRAITQYRSALRDVTALAHRDLVRQWRQFDLSDPVAVRDGLMDTLPPLINGYHLAASTVAADWYDVQRYDLGAKKRFRAVVADQPTNARGAVMARWGVAPMFSADPSAAAPVVLSKIGGALTRVVLDGARQTITGSAAKDPGRVGWVRVGSGECDWCDQFLDGEVHYVEGYDFLAHDNCRCDAVIDVS